MYDVVIIGAGPAGLTATIYALRSKLNALLLDKYTLGGQVLLTETIENFPGFPEGIKSFDLIERLKKQVENLDAQIKFQEVRGIEKKDIFFIKTIDAVYECRSIILAVGSNPKKLDIPGELTLTGRGVSYCAVCDAPFFKKKEVVVIGGGDAAIEEAIYLSRFANKVKVIHRRDQLRATKILQEKAQTLKNIDFILNAIPLEIQGKEKVTGIRIKNVVNSKQQDINADGVFIFVGYEPNTAFLKGFVEVNEDGYIVADNKMSVIGQKGVFACGDCIKKDLYQIVTACSDGAVAAFSAYKYLND